MKNKVLTKKILDKHKVDSGKVREKFSVPDSVLLILLLTTDRISIFDQIIGRIGGKGVVLNALTVFWKDFLRRIVPNDVVTDNDRLIARHYGCTSVSRELQGRLCLVKKAEVVPIECIVRFIMDGSLLKAYRKADGRKNGAMIWGIGFNKGMRKGTRFEMPVFTPSTKAPMGEHDINISYEEMVKVVDAWLKKNPQIVGFTAESLSQAIKSTSLALALIGRDYAKRKGYSLVDTKFEFGIIYDADLGKYVLCLIDEVLTPDSSRYRFKGKYRDKQVVRDYYEKELKWDKVSEPAPIPKRIESIVISDYNDQLARIAT